MNALSASKHRDKQEAQFYEFLGSSRGESMYYSVLWPKCTIAPHNALPGNDVFGEMEQRLSESERGAVLLAILAQHLRNCMHARAYRLSHHRGKSQPSVELYYTV